MATANRYDALNVEEDASQDPLSSPPPSRDESVGERTTRTLPHAPQAPALPITAVPNGIENPPPRQRPAQSRIDSWMVLKPTPPPPAKAPAPPHKEGKEGDQPSRPDSSRREEKRRKVEPRPAQSDEEQEQQPPSSRTAWEVDDWDRESPAEEEEGATGLSAAERKRKRDLDTEWEELVHDKPSGYPPSFPANTSFSFTAGSSTMFAPPSSSALSMSTPNTSVSGMSISTLRSQPQSSIRRQIPIYTARSTPAGSPAPKPAPILAPPPAPLFPTDPDWTFVEEPVGGFTRPNGTTEVELRRFSTATSRNIFDRATGDVKLWCIICDDPPITASADFVVRVPLLTDLSRRVTNDPDFDPTISCTTLEDPHLYKHKMPQPYCFSGAGMTSLHARALMRNSGVWSCKKISVIFFEIPSPTPSLLTVLRDVPIALKNIDDKAERERAEKKVAEHAREVLSREDRFIAFCRTRQDALPPTVRGDPGVTYVLDHIRAHAFRITEDGKTITVYRIDFACPTSLNIEWDKLHRGLRGVTWEGTHGHAKPMRQDIHCGYCKGLDHPTSDCPLKRQGVYENTITTATPITPDVPVELPPNPFDDILQAESERSRASPRPQPKGTQRGPPGQQGARAQPPTSQPRYPPQYQPHFTHPQYAAQGYGPPYQTRGGSTRGRGRGGARPRPPFNSQGYQEEWYSQSQGPSNGPTYDDNYHTYDDAYNGDGGHAYAYAGQRY
ncbi:hypothetical protein DFP72DRAFT_55358 [Ephemerocybe angulata]|uniref:Uncharacterized protein n=1 Tax=Ephemerocybe angulata TaxID=980116 RepID=A0A8H6IAA0_9AGAR|nr:hypothetical protein DFP72DRAFT_55358 [Tulosesus angulatus]